MLNNLINLLPYICVLIWVYVLSERMVELKDKMRDLEHRLQLLSNSLDYNTDALWKEFNLSRYDLKWYVDKKIESTEEEVTEEYPRPEKVS